MINLNLFNVFKKRQLKRRMLRIRKTRSIICAQIKKYDWLNNPFNQEK
jgi:hypothetical protein